MIDTAARSPAPRALGGVARGGAVNLVGSVASALLGFVLVVVITRMLPKEDAGVFFTVTSAFLVIAAVAQLGTGTGVVYFVSRSRALERTGSVPAYLRSASVPVLAVSVLITLAAILSARPLAGLTTPDALSEGATAFRLVSLFVIAAAVESLAVAATRGFGTMLPSAVVTLVLRPGLQVLLVWASVALWGAQSATAAWAAAYAVSAVVAVLWARRLLRRVPTGSAPANGATREFWRFTWPRGVMQVAQVAMQRLDVVLVAALAGVAPAAVYAAATRFVVAGQMGAQAVGLAAQPQFAHLLATGEHREARTLYQVSTGWLVLMTWPLYLVLGAFSGTVTGLFGQGYTGGAIVVVVLAAAFMVGALFGMVEVLLVMSGRTTWTLVNGLMGLAVLVALDIALIPRLGVLGAAVGWAGAIVLRNALGLVQVRTALRMHPFGKPTAAALVVTVAAFGAPLAAGRLLLGDAVPGLLVGLLAGAAVAAAAAFVLRRPLHLDDLVRALRSRGRRRAPAGPVSGNRGGRAAL